MTFFHWGECQDLPNNVINCYKLIFGNLWSKHQSAGNRDISVQNHIVKVRMLHLAGHHRCIKISLHNRFPQGCTMYTSHGEKK